MDQVAPYAKAITGSIIAGLSSLGAVLVGDQELSDVTSGQWVTIAIAFLLGLGAVWAIPNREVPPYEGNPPSSV